MTKYIVVWDEGPEDYGFLVTEAPNKEKLLESISETVLDQEWTIYEVGGEVTKETLVHGGNYDHVLPE